MLLVWKPRKKKKKGKLGTKLKLTLKAKLIGTCYISSVSQCLFTSMFWKIFIAFNPDDSTATDTALRVTGKL